MRADRPLRNRRTAVLTTVLIPFLAAAGLAFASLHGLASRSPGRGRPAAMLADSDAAPPQIPAPKPPMGWSSWNSFSNRVDAQVVMEQAKALASPAFRAAGYQYVNIDEGWWMGERDAQGGFVVDPTAWPALAPGERAGDMANIARYIHSLGLKAGIYTDAGMAGCGHYSPDLGPAETNSGSEGHYDQDMLQFAKWGFDYVKVDWCGGHGEKLDPALQYAEIGRAIDRAAKATGRRLYYSICNWGVDSPWTWAPGIGGVNADIWRTSGDIVAPIVAGDIHADRRASFPKMLSNFDKGIHPEAEHTGYYNDPDMMVIGMPGLTAEQNRVHMSLWAISGAPLLLGADLTKLDPQTTAMVTNSEVIAVDQDPLGLQGIKVAEASPGLQVWAKPLAAPGRLALLFLNRTASPQQISVQSDQLGLDSASPVTVRDLWAGKDLGSFRSSYSVQTAAGDVAMLVVQGTPGAKTSYQPEAEDGGVVFKGVVAPAASAYLRIDYVNGDQSPRRAELRVNGRTPTWVSFPSTGGRLAAVTVEAPLQAPGPNNVVAFSSPCGPAPRIAGLTVLSGQREAAAPQP